MAVTVEVPIEEYKQLKALKLLYKFELGVKVTESITGFSGTVTGRSDCMSGCARYCVTPKQMENSTEYPKSTWLDEGQLTLVEKEQ